MDWWPQSPQWCNLQPESSSWQRDQKVPCHQECLVVFSKLRAIEEFSIAMTSSLQQKRVWRGKVSTSWKTPIGYTRQFASNSDFREKESLVKFFKIYWNFCKYFFLPFFQNLYSAKSISLSTMSYAEILSILLLAILDFHPLHFLRWFFYIFFLCLQNFVKTLLGQSNLLLWELPELPQHSL